MGNFPLMELLLAHNANINVQGGSEKMTVLHEAVSSENSDETLIKFLLEHGADPHIEYEKNKTKQRAYSLIFLKGIKMEKLQLIFYRKQRNRNCHV